MRLTVVMLLTLVFTGNAYSYLDPGTGSFVLQMLIAGLASALLAVKIFWNNIKAFFAGIFGKGKKTKK